MCPVIRFRFAVWWPKKAVWRCIVAWSVAFFCANVVAGEKTSVCVVPDRALGSADCVPFADLETWIDRFVDNLVKSGQNSDELEFTLSAGVFRLERPFTLRGQDLRGRVGRVRIAGAGVGQTLIRGTQSVNPTSSMVSPAVARSVDARVMQHLRKIDLAGLDVDWRNPLGVRRFGDATSGLLMVFASGNRLPRARWPNDGFADIRQDDSLARSMSLRLSKLDGRRFADEPAMLLSGHFYHRWAEEVLPARASASSGAFSFPGLVPTYGVRSGQTARVENALGAIDLPGEWVLVPQERAIYLWMPDGAHDEGVEITVASDGFLFHGMTQLEVSDLTFEGFQSAGVRVEKSDDVSIHDVEIAHVGDTALRLNGYGVRAFNISIRDSGGTGVAISGGDRRTLAPGNNVLADCTIERTGRDVRTYAPAVGISGVGNTLERCRLRDGPHAAVVFHGNDHRIYGNLIEDFAQSSDDAGALYTGRDWTERGTVIEENVILRSGGAKGSFGINAIYLDDQASGITIRNNLIGEARRGVLVGGGRDNLIENNVFFSCADGVYIDNRGADAINRLGYARAMTEFESKLRGVGAMQSPYSERYPQLRRDRSMLGHAANNTIRGNVFWQCKDPIVFRKAPDSVAKVGQSWLATSFFLSDAVAPGQIARFVAEMKHARSVNAGTHAVVTRRSQ